MAEMKLCELARAGSFELKAVVCYLMAPLKTQAVNSPLTQRAPRPQFYLYFPIKLLNFFTVVCVAALAQVNKLIRLRFPAAAKKHAINVAFCCTGN